MTYVVAITLPLSFEADSDDHARLLLSRLEHLLTELALPLGAELDDAPHSTLAEALPYLPLRDVDTWSETAASFDALLPATCDDCGTELLVNSVNHDALDPATLAVHDCPEQSPAAIARALGR